MKIIESKDGTIKVIELDPSKEHMMIVDDDCHIAVEQVRMVDGAIIMKIRGTSVCVVEGASKT